MSLFTWGKRMREEDIKDLIIRLDERLKYLANRIDEKLITQDKKIKTVDTKFWTIIVLFLALLIKNILI